MELGGRFFGALAGSGKVVWIFCPSPLIPIDSSTEII
jgi:hypothetical protein